MLKLAENRRSEITSSNTDGKKLLSTVQLKKPQLPDGHSFSDVSTMAVVSLKTPLKLLNSSATSVIPCRHSELMTHKVDRKIYTVIIFEV
ncbi:hypothetical protein H671_xg20003 [Cricetulus griseus]|nr:hypothetical protein H671_xg20003 [Cricetulus griseus]